METESSVAQPAPDDVRVLVVDDQQSFRAVARRLIEATDGFALVAESQSGEEAVARSTSASVSLVLMDVHLPGISGIEATRRIVASMPSTAVVLTSTHDEPSFPAEAAMCGAVRYVREEDLTPALLRDIWSSCQRRSRR